MARFPINLRFRIPPLAGRQLYCNCEAVNILMVRIIGAKFSANFLDFFRL